MTPKGQTRDIDMLRRDIWKTAGDRDSVLNDRQ